MSQKREPRVFDYTKTEVIAGAFVMGGVAVLGYLSVSIGGFALLPRDRYPVIARFSNVGDLKAGAPVKVAGVTIGKVRTIRLADYFGEAELALEKNIALPKDTIASITTAGLLGDAYVSLSPGASESDLKAGDRISHTEPALNIADLLGRFAFGSGASPSESGAADASGSTQPTTPPAKPASPASPTSKEPNK